MLLGLTKSSGDKRIHLLVVNLNLVFDQQGQGPKCILTCEHYALDILR